MYCNNCGSNNQLNSTFCANCGAPLSQYQAVPPKKNNIWIIIIPIVVIAIVLIIALSGSTDKYVGTWNCKGYSSTSGESGDYMVTLVLKSNGEYTFGQYGDLDNNHSIGTFTSRYEESKKKSTGHDFYQLDFQNREFIINGVKQSGNYTMSMEMELVKRNEALIINAKTYAMYYCYK